MNRDDIIRMAREAGFRDTTTPVVALGVSWEQVQRFAALVAAHEREACAKVADEQAQDEPYGHAKFRCGNIAAAIRARSEQCG
jgi:hypothetical protein